MLNILFVTGATHEPYMANLNHFQRVYFLSRWTNLTVFARKGADFSASAVEGTTILHTHFRSKLWMILACFWWMCVRRQARHYDIVLTEPSKLCLCGLFAKAMLGSKWVVDVWDIPFRSKPSSSVRRLIVRFDRRVARVLFRWADLFVLSILPDLEFRAFGVPNEKMLLLKNAIWLDKHTRGRPKRGSSGSRPFTILCMRSRFTHDMGLDLLAQAYEAVSEGCPDMRMTIIGKIPEEIWPQVARLSGRSDVSFREFVEHDELMSLMASSGACVVPFRNTTDLAQTYPIKVLEYLSCGAVVIAPDLPGISSMIRHDDNGLLFRPDDSGDLGEKLRMIYENPEHAARISARAAALSEEFDCRNKAKVIFDALERLCTGEQSEATNVPQGRRRKLRTDGV
jgi:glycosyltransferase involved in cell wall biosynthesis